jgi:hypothetical protein
LPTHKSLPLPFFLHSQTLTTFSPFSRALHHL